MQLEVIVGYFSDMSDTSKLNIGDLVRFSRSTSPSARGHIYIIENVKLCETYRGQLYCNYTIKPVHSFMDIGGARRVKNACKEELSLVDLIELGKEFMRFQTFIETYVKGKSSDQGE